jgi:hypothetical protein
MANSNMGLLLVLNDETKLEPLLKTYLVNDVRGCTIFDSKGMTHQILENDGDPSHFAAIRNLIVPGRSNSKTLLIIGSEAEIQRVVTLTLEIVGDLNKPDTGFMVTFPIAQIYGRPSSAKKVS